jgi:hypothetical protein
MPQGSPILTVRLHPTQQGSITGRKLAFPDTVPLGARYREGALAIDYDQQVAQAKVETPLAEAEPEEEGPWGQRVPDDYFPYRGQTPSLTVELQRQPHQLWAKCATDVYLSPGRIVVETQVHLEAEGGSPRSIDLTVSTPVTGAWNWHAVTSAGTPEQRPNPVHHAERLGGVEAAAALAVLGASDPLQATVGFATCLRGERWRITLDRPLRVRQPLVLHASRKLEPAGDRWDVPLPVVLGSERLEGDVTLHLMGADLVQVDAPGLREAPLTAADPRSRSATAWRTFRYSHPLLGLSLQGTRAGGRSTAAVADQAALTTFTTNDGVLHHRFTFRLANWSRRTLPVRLPHGATCLAVRIDGLWLSHLPLLREDDAGAVLELPVPERMAATEQGVRDGPPHQIEMVYETTTAAWSLWSRLAAPAPQLPVEPIELRRTWRLPPGVSPLSHKRHRRLPGPGEGSEPALVDNRPLELLRLPLARPRPWSVPEADPVQRQALADAAQALRSAQAGQTLLFRQVLAELLFVHLRNRQPLIIDSAALRTAGVGPQYPLTIVPPAAPEDQAYPWESLGLVVLHARPAPLLTTRAQRDVWQPPGRQAPVSEALEAALAEAVLFGHDASGRFRSAAVWAGEIVAAPGEAAGPSRPLLGFEAAHARWTEWEPLPGAAEQDRLVAVRHDAVSAAGLGITAVLLLVLWAVRRSPWLPRLLAGIVTTAGLGLVWLPAALHYLAWWPLLAGCVGGLIWYLRAVSGSLPARPMLPSAPAGATLTAIALVLFGAASWVGQAAFLAPGDYTVYLLPESGRPGDKPSVLVPTELLDELQALSRSPVSGPDPVLLGASYQGQVVDGMAEFDAEFHLQCLGDEDATVLLPLDGVQLQGEVWLDGAPARPTAAAPPRIGFVLKVGGRGRHKVELRFRVPLTATAEDHEVQFGLPRLLHSRLAFRLPAQATHPQVLGRQGIVRLASDDQGERLEVDLGRMTAPLRLRWRQPAQPPVAPRVTFRDAYLWDLRPDASTLTGLVRYTIPRGAVEVLAVDLPAELEVRGVEVLGSPGDEGGPRLGNWQVVETEGTRVLRLEFTNPVSGDLQVSLDLVPRAPLAAVVALPLPQPRGQRLPGLSFLGYRVRGLSVRLLESRHVTGREAAHFAEFWPEVLRPDPATIVFACNTWPDAHKPPLLRLRLNPHPARTRVRQDLQVRAGLEQADVEATVELTAPAGDLSLVEWRLSPGLTITDVTGTEVRQWSQLGARLLVWLEGARESTKLEWSGWLRLANAGSSAWLAFPQARPLSAESMQTTLHIQAGPGLALDPIAVSRDQFQVPPEARPSDRELVFVTKHLDYGGACRVQSTSANAEAQVLTFAEARDGRLMFTARVAFPVVHGQLRSVQVRLHNWEGEDVRLQADQLAQAPVLRRRSQGERNWTLEFQPGVGPGYQLQLTGSLPLDEAGADQPMPDVAIVGVDTRDRWVAVGGGELAGESAFGLRAEADPARALKAWPGELERLRRSEGALLRVIASDWRLRLVAREPQPGPTNVRVFLTERSAAVANGRRWLHEAAFWLRHDAATTLNMTLPAPAAVVTVAVDGVAVAPLQSDGQHLELRLPGRAGLHKVRLCWLYAAAEPLDRPNLACPRLEGVADGPIVWDVAVPSGWKAALAESDLQPGVGIAAALDLHRAAVQLVFSRHWHEGGRERGPLAAEALAAAQDRFYQFCRHASHVLDLTGEGTMLTAPSGQSLRDWLRELLAANQELATRQGFEDVRAEAERHSRAEKPAAPTLPMGYEGDRPIRGTPVFAQAGGDAPTPRLHLVPEDGPGTALAVSAQWLAVAAVVWGLSFFPAWAVRLRPFWPEQALLLGLLGWYLAGPTLAVLFLLVLGACGRLVILGLWAASLLSRPPRKSGSNLQARM